MIRQILAVGFMGGLLVACNNPETEQHLDQIGSATESLAVDAASAVSTAAVDLTTSEPYKYECANGTRLSVVYHMDKADVTILGNTDQTVSLPKIDSEKGELYAAGDHRLHRDGDAATWGLNDTCARTEF
ncbi:MAG: MliC family protein [Asticcacaulis sp.]